MDLLKDGNFEKLSKRKIVALCLVLASFAALLFPWITMSVDVMGTKYTMQDIMNLAYSESGSTQAEINAEFQSYVADMVEEAAEDGVHIDGDKMMDVFRLIMNGTASPFECASACSFISDLLGKAAASAANESGLGMVTAKMFENMHSSTTAAAVGLWAILALMAVTMVYAVYSLLTDKKYGTIAYCGVSVIAFVVFAIATNKLNSSTLSVFSGIFDMFEDLGLLSSSSSIEWELFHLSAAPFICAIAAIAALVVEKVNIPCDAALPIPRVKQKWVCACGATNDDVGQYCSACGKARIAAERCSCGALIKPGDAFCSKCGARIGSKPAPAPEPSPSPKPVPESPMDSPNVWQDLGDL